MLEENKLSQLWETLNIKEDLNVSDGNSHVLIFAINFICCFSDFPDFYKSLTIKVSKVEMYKLVMRGEGGQREELRKRLEVASYHSPYLYFYMNL